MFSEAVLEHFKNPRNVGRLSNADATVQVTNPVCGDILKLAIRREGNRIVVRFLCRGCTTAIACASFLTEQMLAISATNWQEITVASISTMLGELPLATRHGAQLAVDALRAIEREIAKL